MKYLKQHTTAGTNITFQFSIKKTMSIKHIQSHFKSRIHDFYCISFRAYRMNFNFSHVETFNDFISLRIQKY